MPKESRSVPVVEQGQTRRCDVTKKEFPCEKMRSGTIKTTGDLFRQLNMQQKNSLFGLYEAVDINFNDWHIRTGWTLAEPKVLPFSGFFRTTNSGIRITQHRKTVVYLRRAEESEKGSSLHCQEYG